LPIDSHVCPLQLIRSIWQQYVELFPGPARAYPSYPIAQDTSWHILLNSRYRGLRQNPSAGIGPLASSGCLPLDNHSLSYNLLPSQLVENVLQFLGTTHVYQSTGSLLIDIQYHAISSDQVLSQKKPCVEKVHSIQP